MFAIKGEIPQHYLFKDFLINTGQILTFGTTQPIIWGFWFLQSLFIVTLIFLGVSWLTIKKLKAHERTRFVLIFCIFIFGVILAQYDLNLPRSGVTSLVCVLFFYFGFLFHNANKIPLNIEGFICAVTVLTTSVILYDEHINVASHVYIRFPYFVTNALCGIYAVLCISQLMASRFNCTFIKYLGTCTLHILALHIISFKVVALIQIYVCKYPIIWLAKYPVIDGGGGWWIAYTAAGVMIPTLLCYAMRRVRSILFSSPAI